MFLVFALFSMLPFSKSQPLPFTDPPVEVTTVPWNCLSPTSSVQPNPVPTPESTSGSTEMPTVISTTGAPTTIIEFPTFGTNEPTDLPTGTSESTSLPTIGTNDTTEFPTFESNDTTEFPPFSNDTKPECECSAAANKKDGWFPWMLSVLF